jgi:hypothetical protein
MDIFPKREDSNSYCQVGLVDNDRKPKKMIATGGLLKIKKYAIWGYNSSTISHESAGIIHSTI